jgi:hypothetical protein
MVAGEGASRRVGCVASSRRRGMPGARGVVGRLLVCGPARPTGSVLGCSGTPESCPFPLAEYGC